MTAATTSEPFLFTPDASGPPPRGPGGDRPSAMVDQARQEISHIVREVAQANRSDKDRDRYVRFLADRIMRAIAAQGVVIWKSAGPQYGDDIADAIDPETGHRFVVEYRIGTVTDVQFDPTAAAVHDALLMEIAAHNEPVVVPPTPGAADRDVPANPSSVPVALVPVSIDPLSAMPTCLIEVFLEPGGSTASQRGVLRFLSQMGDLAGDFLRTDRLRSLTRRRGAMDRCVRVIDSLQNLPSTSRVEAAWADALSAILSCPRVAICRVDFHRPKIVAVSHVDRIDHHGEAAEAIRRAASVPLGRQRNLSIATMRSPSELVAEQVAEHVAEPAAAAENQTRPIRPHLVAAINNDSRWRVVMLRRVGEREAETESTPEFEDLLERLLIGGGQAWRSAHRIECFPGGKWWLQLSASDTGDDVSKSNQTATQSNQRSGRSPVSRIRRRIGLIVAIGLAAGLLFGLPIPSIVSTTGLIRPSELDTYHANLDATIQTIHVTHGQTVRRGDPLVTLTSKDLDEQQTTLLGRRAILVQRREQFNRNLVSPDRRRDGFSNLGGEEIQEEIDSINQQLQLISRSQDELTLRARRDGRVDAWRIEPRFGNRPLHRGDAVLSLIADETNWVVDATIPRNRIRRVDDAMAVDHLSANVAPRWSPDQSQEATPDRFGPIWIDPIDGTEGIILRMNLSSSPKLGDQPLAEVPARITMKCGRTTVGSFLLQDFFNWVRTRIGSYRR